MMCILFPPSYFFRMDFMLPRAGKFDYVGDMIPKHLLRYLVPHSQRQYKLFGQGELLTQVMPGVNYSIWIHYFFITKPCTLRPVSEESALALNYMLIGDIPCVLTGYGKVLVRQNLCSLFYVPGKVFHKARFKAGRYCCVHINFPLSLLQPVAQQYPVFRPILMLAESKLRQSGVQEPLVIYPYVKKLIDEMLYCDLGPGERVLFVESQIRVLLRLYVRDQGTGNNRANITNYQLATLSKLEEFIQMHLDENVPVLQIAKACGVGRSWLQQICKSYYGVGVHELVTGKRMDKAADLLLSTDMQIGEIVARVSSVNFSAFTAAFRKRFRQSPSSFRKNKGQNRQRFG